MSGSLSDWALRGVSRQVLFLARSEPLAVATGWAIRSEAMWRQVVGLEVNARAAVVGLQTGATRRRRQEHAEAAQMRVRAPETAPGRRTRPPAVNWHEGGAGPAVLLLNGWTASGLAWPTAWLRRLERHYRVIRIDNRGTGWSRTAPAPFTIANMADDARDVLRACGVDRAVVLGTSMGGMIAQELALRHPAHVEALVLVATVPPVPARVNANHPWPVIALRSMLAPDEELREHLKLGRFAGEGFAAAHPDIVEELAAQLRRRPTPRSMVFAQSRAIGSWHGPGRLRRLSVATTVVQGESDRLVPAANGRRLAELIRGAKYEELPGVGHLVAEEAGDALLRMLRCVRDATETTA